MLLTAKSCLRIAIGYYKTEQGFAAAMNLIAVALTLKRMSTGRSASLQSNAF